MTATLQLLWGRLHHLMAGSIRRRLVVSIALVHAVLMTLFVADLMHRQLTNLREQSASRAFGLTRVVAVNSVSWVLAEDVRGLSEMVRSLRNQPHLKWAMVVDPRGQVLAHTDSDRLGYFVSDPVSLDLLHGEPAPRTTVETQHMIEVAMPIMAGTRLIAWARIALDRQEEIEAIRWTLYEGGFYILTAILFGTLCALWIAKRLTAHLQQLGEAADRLKAGQREITALERPAAEIARVEQAFVSMADTIWHREDALRESVDRLAASNTDLERFAYVASHDLQEPLRAVVSFSQLLEKRFGEQIGTEGQEYIKYIVQGGKRMSQLVQGLLEFSRIDAKGQRFTDLPLGQALDAALENLSDAIRREDASIEAPPPPLPVVRGDPVQLMMLLQNLIGNAIKFHRRGEQPKVRLDCRPGADGMVELRVIDNGIGIEPEHAQQVFQIFRRLHHRESYSGHGIGLAVCRRIVERHGGAIWYERDAGGGSCFVCTLPPATGEQPEERLPAQEPLAR